MSHRIFPFVMACALVMGTPSAVRAAPQAAAKSAKVRDALTGPAREAFDRASALFANEDFAGARTEFERAFELSQDARVLYNVAVCDKSRHKYASAMAALEKSLALGGDGLPKAYTERVRDTLATLAPFVATIEIHVSEPDAKVYLDDEPVPAEKLGRPIRVDVGDHTISAKKAGYLDEPRKVRVTSGVSEKVVMSLEPQQKRADVVVVATKVQKARVLVDGVDLGPLPFSGVLEVGKHAITVRAPGHASETRTVDVTYGKPLRLEFDLAREAHEARLRVVTTNDADTISLDGRVIGKGGFFGAVPAGEHVLRVSRDGAKSRTVDLVLRDDETRSLDVTLDEAKGGLPTWVWIVGGVALAGAATTTAAVIGTQSTSFQGSSPGTLDPRVVLAGRGASR